MQSLTMSLALISVIALSLALGIGLGYAIIFGILDLFDRSRQAYSTASRRIVPTSAGQH